MYLTIRAIVLRVTDYNDRDALLTVLSRDHGKLTIKARGLRRKNSPLIAPCQLLAYGEFTLFEYRGMYTINEAHSIELFRNLRKELTKLSLGTYFAQVTEVISQEDLPNPELFGDTPLPEISPQRGKQILTQSEELEYTLRFNVNEELALRTFVLNTIMKQEQI